MTQTVVFTESTPNPLTRKFSFGRDLANTPFEAGAHPALAPLLDAGVMSVFVGADYLSLTVGDADHWTETAPKAISAIQDNVEAIVAMAREKGEAGSAVESDDPVVRRIMEILDTNIRPAVAHDGGDVNFVAFDDGVLVLEMSGACSGCPSSTATLKMGIQNMMSYFVPEVRDVVAAER